MSVPLEHDYIGLSEASKSSSIIISPKNDNKTVLHLKATELRLGLPGLCQDLEENCFKNRPMKNNVSRNKRGFYDVDGKWGFNERSEEVKVNDGTKTEKLLVSLVVEEKKKGFVNGENCRANPAAAAAAKLFNRAQVVGWPPIRSFRKNTMATNLSKNGDVAEVSSACGGCLYVKVSMDGAPYLRKVDLKTCKNYTQLLNALEKMFNCFNLGQCSSIRGKEGLNEGNLKDLLHRDECVLTYEDKEGDWMLVGDVPWEMFVGSCKRLRIMKGSEATGLAPRSVEKSKNYIR